MLFNIELLSQKYKSNKMTPQNIAIVMSPNLLWSAETNDADYVSKVNSTASVNTIVEALVSDWSYFFGDDFAIADFYVTISRDELFPHNGGFPVDRDFSTDTMTKSLNIVPSSGGLNQNSHLIPLVGGSSIHSYQTHSRASSHDTSLILIENEISGGCSTDSLTKRSQSNSSLSDSSPPPQSSPKLPIRRKNTKKAAPTPPDSRSQRSAEHYANINIGSNQSAPETMIAMKERFLNSIPTAGDDTKYSSNRFLRNETKAQTNTTSKPPSTPISMKQCSSSTENLSATKPDKPPRPAMPVIDSQTLVRNAFKSKGSERHSRPIALPRNILNVARSTENLSTVSPVKTSPSALTNDDTEIILLRDKSNENNRNDKPAIPERPTSLMKPNLRAAYEKFDSHHLPESPGGIKKTQSFRMSSTPSGNAIGSITGRSLTTLERTHIYNVDKKQVEIIDVDQPNGNGNDTDHSTNGKSSPSDKENIDKEKDCDESMTAKESNGEPIKSSESADRNHTSFTVNTTSSSTINASNDFAVPQSPRCFEPKLIKRPQIPAPPPPNATNDSNQGCSESTPNRISDAAAAAADFTKL